MPLLNPDNPETATAWCPTTPEYQKTVEDAFNTYDLDVQYFCNITHRWRDACTPVWRWNEWIYRITPRHLYCLNGYTL